MHLQRDFLEDHGVTIQAATLQLCVGVCKQVEEMEGERKAVCVGEANRKE